VTVKRTDDLTDEPTRLRAVGALVALLAIFVGIPLLTWKLAGWPLPDHLPDLTEIRDALGRRDISDTTFLKIVATGIWILWAYLVGCALNEAITLARGHERSSRRTWNPLSLGVRRLVATAALLVTVSQSAAALALPAGSASTPKSDGRAAAAAAPRLVYQTPVASPVEDAAPIATATPSSVQEMTVGKRDNLFTIAQRYLGDGNRRGEIVKLNSGRTMADGSSFSSRLQPGWTLLIPLPAAPPAAQTPSPPPATPSPVQVDGESYTVKRGDTLSTIVRRHYGRIDLSIVTRVFEANRGITDGAGHTLDNPNRIWPGMELALPGLEPLDAQSVPAVPPSVDAIQVPTAATHTVVHGDTLWDIVATHYGRVDATMVQSVFDVNRAPAGAGIVDPDLIRPGMVVVLPTLDVDGSLAAPAPPPPPPAVAAAAVEPPPAPTVVEPPPVVEAVELPSLRPPEPAPLPPPMIEATPARSLPAPPRLVWDAPAEQHGRELPVVPAGLAGSALVTTGAVELLRRRRRRRLQRLGPVAAVDESTPALTAAETGVRLNAALPTIDRLDVALRALSANLGADPWARGRPLVVVHRGDGRLEIIPSGGDGPVPEPWTTEGGRWVLGADVDLTALMPVAAAVAPPCPALVQVGTLDGSAVYVDLEAAGIVHLAGSPAEAESLATYVVAQLSVSPLAHALHVVTAGLPPVGRLGERARLRSVTDAAAARGVVEPAAATVRAALAAVGAHSTFALRAMAPYEAWEPAVAVVLAGGADRAGIPALAGLALGGDRGAVLVTDVLCDGALVLKRDGAELIIGDTGLRVCPLPWSHATTEALAGLLAEPAPVADGAPVPVEAADLPDWTAMIRLLGPVDVVREDGTPVEVSVKTLELLTWLATRGGRGRRVEAQHALYPFGNDRAFAATLAETRTMLRGLGTELLGADEDELALPGEVISDLDVFRWFTQRAAQVDDDRQACEQLQQAISLVRGVPLTGLEHAVWPDAERHTDRFAHEVVRSVLTYGHHGLAAGLTADVLAAAELGLSVVPGQQHLVCLKVDAHLKQDDVDAAAAELDRLREIVSHDDAEGGDLCAAAVDRIHLVQGRRSA
jgi:nucleoid-associated protein YgaU